MKVTYYLFGLVGIALAACAAYVSVTGWAEVFAGSALTVTVIMAVIEAGKVTAASLAYRLREVAPRTLTALLVATTVVTMFLTSMGIYGFFSKAYQTSASKVAQKEAKIEALEEKKQQFQGRLENVDESRKRLNKRLDQAQDRVQTLTEQYNERGWATDKQALEEAQRQVQNMRNRLSARAQLSMALNDSLSSVNQKLTRLRTTSTDAEAKLSAVQFAADIFGYPRETIANIFILAIVFVFDPAAIAIIIATNVAAEKSGQGGFFEETITEEHDSEELYEQAREGYRKAIEEGETDDWEEQMEEDVEAGKLDEIARDVRQNYEQGNTYPVPSTDTENPLKEAVRETSESTGEYIRRRHREKQESMPDGVAETPEDLDEAIRERNRDPEPASFSLISWLQRTQDPIVTTYRDWSRNVDLPENPVFETGEAEDYIEQELQELNSPDSIRREVSRIMGEGPESDNRYVIKANGGVDHDPTRER